MIQPSFVLRSIFLLVLLKLFATLVSSWTVIWNLQLTLTISLKCQCTPFEIYPRSVATSPLKPVNLLFAHLLPLVSSTVTLFSMAATSLLFTACRASKFMQLVSLFGFRNAATSPWCLRTWRASSQGQDWIQDTAHGVSMFAWTRPYIIDWRTPLRSGLRSVHGLPFWEEYGGPCLLHLRTKFMEPSTCWTSKHYIATPFQN